MFSNPVVNLSELCVLSYGRGITQWAYTAPIGHVSHHLGDPSYWLDANQIVHQGDWLFVTHTAPQGTYNILYAFTKGPLGIWAQQLMSTVPPIGR